MIARIWHGTTTVAQSDDYLAFLKQRAIPDYQAIQGNRSVYILRRIEGEQAHFLTLTFWESREAIQTFASVEIEQAKTAEGVYRYASIYSLCRLRLTAIGLGVVEANRYV